MSKTPSARGRLIVAGGRYGAAVGVAIGFLAAASTHPNTPYSCSNRSPATEVANCFGDGLVAALQPYLIHMGTGFLAGGLMGMLLIRGGCVAAGLVRARVHVHRTALAPSPAGHSSPSTPAARRMLARYASRCTSCGEQIEVGTLIEHRGPRQTVCGTCAAAEPLPAA